MNKPIYLDYAAATPLDEKVFLAMKSYFTDKFYNPSANYLLSQQIKNELTSARETIAATLGAKKTEIIFTSGGSESNNLAINGIMRKYPEKKVLISPIEHDSVYQPAKNYNYDFLKINTQGIIDLAQLEKTITDEVVMISVVHVSNEIGVVQPLNKIAKIKEKIIKARQQNGVNTPLYLHSDACQSPLYFDLKVNRLGVDLLTLNGSKIYGPKGVGCLYVKSSVTLKSQIQGGGQQRNIRSGTENVPGIIGLAKSLELAEKNRANETKRIYKLQSYFFNKLQQIELISINGSLKNRTPANIHITIQGVDNERLLYELEEHNILAARGSACSGSSVKPSRVLESLGLDDQAARSSIRLTLGRSNTTQEIDYTMLKLRDILNR